MLKRGFKTWCERMALSYKKELGIGKKDPMKAVTLAEHLHVKLFTPQNIPGLNDANLKVLLHEESNAWSAVTLCKGNKYIVIYNPCRGNGRQSNDIMHELSHIIIGHKAQIMHSLESEIFLRYYDQSQEQEADWLAGTLLLNRDALFHIAFSGMELFMAAKKYEVSEPLLNMRLNITGVKAIQKRKLEQI